MTTEKIQQFNQTLRDHNYTLFCAESITAGLLASTITSIPGASAVLKGSIVTYQGEIKTKLLGVSSATIETYTAESMETTKEMVQGLVHLGLGASIYVAITGVASVPTTKYVVDKEVGQIYVAIYFKEMMHCFETIIQKIERNEIRTDAVEFVFDRILDIIGNDTK